MKKRLTLSLLVSLSTFADDLKGYRFVLKVDKTDHNSFMFQLCEKPLQLPCSRE